MKFTTALIFSAGVYRVSATSGVGAALCMAACTPLVINPVAYAACTAGCAALNVGDKEAGGTPKFMPDGTIVFEKESPECEALCDPLDKEPITYAACLFGCAGQPAPSITNTGNSATATPTPKVGRRGILLTS